VINTIRKTALNLKVPDKIFWIKQEDALIPENALILEDDLIPEAMEDSNLIYYFFNFLKNLIFIERNDRDRKRFTEKRPNFAASRSQSRN